MSSRAVAGLIAATLMACSSPTAAPEPERPARPLHLALDTLNVEVQNLWVRISATSERTADVTLQWELEARTANPFWNPKVVTRAGGQRFDSPGSAQIWGNVPRAYDFRLVVTGLTTDGEAVADTLDIQAPLCRDPARPGLVCNVGVPSFGRGSRGGSD